MNIHNANLSLDCLGKQLSICSADLAVVSNFIEISRIQKHEVFKSSSYMYRALITAWSCSYDYALVAKSIGQWKEEERKQDLGD